MNEHLNGWVPRILSIFRIMYGLLFLEHGTSKILHFPQATNSHALEIFSLGGISGLLELVGGLLLAIGLFTRPVAFIAAGEMAVAYFMVHAPQGFFPLLNLGELAILYCFAFLLMAAAGGGSWSVDEYLRSRQEAALTARSATL